MINKHFFFDPQQFFISVNSNQFKILHNYIIIYYSREKLFPGFLQISTLIVKEYHTIFNLDRQEIFKIKFIKRLDKRN
jgi:hypothetical protein